MSSPPHEMAWFILPLGDHLQDLEAVTGISATTMVVLRLLRWTTKVLVGLVMSAFVLGSVLITLNKVLLSSVFQKFSSIYYFPFITKALKKGAEAEGFAFLAEDRLYSVAVKTLPFFTRTCIVDGISLDMHTCVDKLPSFVRETYCC